MLHDYKVLLPKDWHAKEFWKVTIGSVAIMSTCDELENGESQYRQTHAKHAYNGTYYIFVVEIQPAA